MLIVAAVDAFYCGGVALELNLRRAPEFCAATSSLLLSMTTHPMTMNPIVPTSKTLDGVGPNHNLIFSAYLFYLDGLPLEELIRRFVRTKHFSNAHNTENAVDLSSPPRRRS